MASRNGGLSGPVAQAAERLLGRLGPDGFTMEDLARESKVSRATLYRQVKSREAVLEALAAQGVAVPERQPTAERILEACRTVFGRKGFDAATLEEVATEAGVSAPTVYRQFGDKAGLIRAFAERAGPRRALASKVMEPTGDLRADLERLAETLLRNVSEDGDLLKIGLLERLRGSEWWGLLQASPVKVRTGLGKFFEAQVKRGTLRGEPHALARSFLGLVFGHLLEPLFDGTPLPDPKATAHAVTTLFLDGAAARRSK